jgi:hypothetical protein
MRTVKHLLNRCNSSSRTPFPLFAHSAAAVPPLPMGQIAAGNGLFSGNGIASDSLILTTPG